MTTDQGEADVQGASYSLTRLWELISSIVIDMSARNNIPLCGARLRGLDKFHLKKVLIKEFEVNDEWTSPKTA